MNRIIAVVLIVLFSMALVVSCANATPVTEQVSQVERAEMNRFVADQLGVRELPLPSIVYKPDAPGFKEGHKAYTMMLGKEPIIIFGVRSEPQHFVHELTHYYLIKNDLMQGEDMRCHNEIVAYRVQWDWCEANNCPVGNSENVRKGHPSCRGTHDSE